MIEGDKLVAVFFKKFASRIEGGASFMRGQKRKEKLRALPQRLNGARNLRSVELLALQQLFDIACEFVHAKVTDRNSKVVSGNVFEFMRFVKNNRAALGKHAGVGRALSF